MAARGGLSRGMARLRYRLARGFDIGSAAAVLDAERDRWFLFAPVAFGCGIGIYFSLYFEPRLSVAAGIFLFTAFLTFLTDRRHAFYPLVLGATLAAGGFLAVKWRAEASRAPVIESRLNSTYVEGRIVSIELAPPGKSERWTIAPTRIGRMESLPDRLRISVKPAFLSGEAEAGESVRFRAILFPPPRPAEPGAFDFARRAWFDGIGGSGAALSEVRVTTGQPLSYMESVGAFIDNLRNRLARKVSASIEDPTGESPTGGIAAALLFGTKRLITEESRVLLRDAGLAHILAISGLHMACFAGALFFLFRAGLAAFPSLALRRPIKKWAVFPAFVGAGAYLVLAGASVATQRAFIMFLVIGAAILAGRPALTMRNAALAALAVLFLSPESLIEASFQMSFAATIAIVAAYEMVPVNRLILRRSDSPRFSGRIFYAPAALLLTSLAALFATGLFAAWHFNRIAFFPALAANLLALPVFSLLVMPSAIVSLVLMPLGLEFLALAPMGWGIDLILFLSRFVTDLLGGSEPVRSPPLGAFLLFIGGGLWFCLWHGKIRYGGIIGIAGGALAVMLVSSPPPDLIVARDGSNLALRGEDGRLYLARSKGSTYAAGLWLRRDGDPRGIEEAATGFACTRTGCISRVSGAPPTVLLLRKKGSDALCAQAVVVVSRFVMDKSRCPLALVFIDRSDLDREGSIEGRFEEGLFRRRTSAEVRGERPWSAGAF